MARYAIEENGKVHCFGRSESLDVEGRGEDDEIVIARQLAASNPKRIWCHRPMCRNQANGSTRSFCNYPNKGEGSTLPLNPTEEPQQTNRKPAAYA